MIYESEKDAQTHNDSDFGSFSFDRNSCNMMFNGKSTAMFNLWCPAWCWSAEIRKSSIRRKTDPASVCIITNENGTAMWIPHHETCHFNYQSVSLIWSPTSSLNNLLVNFGWRWFPNLEIASDDQLISIIIFLYIFLYTMEIISMKGT